MTVTAGSTWPCSTVFPQAWLTKVTLLTPLRSSKPGSSAGILIFENRWATSFVAALRRGEADLVAAGYIPYDTLVSSLDATEPAGA